MLDPLGTTIYAYAVRNTQESGIVKMQVGKAYRERISLMTLLDMSPYRSFPNDWLMGSADRAVYTVRVTDRFRSAHIAGNNRIRSFQCIRTHSYHDVYHHMKPQHLSHCVAKFVGHHDVRGSSNINQIQ